jgi:hypothetical protein
VTAQAQQQRHRRQFGDEHVYGAVDDVAEAVDGGSGAGALFVEHSFERAQGAVEGEGEQLFLRGDVVVDRGLREPESFREQPHRGGLVAVLVEGGDGDLEDAALVVPGATSPALVDRRHPISVASRAARDGRS